MNAGKIRPRPRPLTYIAWCAEQKEFIRSRPRPSCTLQSIYATRTAHRQARRTPKSQMGANVPPDLDGFVRRCRVDGVVVAQQGGDGTLVGKPLRLEPVETGAGVTGSIYLTTKYLTSCNVYGTAH